MASETDRSSPVKEGDVLAAKYRVEKVLGAGGMGVVVAAHHLELDERVALKFLLPQAASNTELVERFLREARASVRLKGAHVAKTLDVGRLADNCPYIVMEYLEGHDLHAEIKGASAAALPIETAVGYMLQAAEGLAEAHSRGIVHRDLKPGNLFLTRGVDGHPLVKVLDFGISKTLDTGVGAEGLSLTRTEMLLGSPLYMSPEQMRSSKHVDERSDLWALGAITYELLTGQVPFLADTILELCFKVAQENAPNPQTLRPEIPDGLAAAVLRCLEKLPEDRFGNVSELARAFEPFGGTRERGTADRTLDVLGTGKRKPRSSSPSAHDLSSFAPSPITPPPAPQSSLASTALETPSARPPAPEPASQAWVNTQSQPKTRSRRGVYAIGAAVAVVAAIGGAALLHHSPAAPPAPTSTLAAVTSVTPAAPTKAEPTASAVTTLIAESPVVEADASLAPPVKPRAASRPAIAASAVGVAAKKPGAAAAPSIAAPPPPPAAPPGDFIKVRE